MYSKASLDKTAVFITIGIGILFFAISFHLTTLLIETKIVSTAFFIYLLHLLLLQATFGLGWLYAPKGYSVNKHGICIKRAIGSFIIKLDEIVQVTVFPENKIKSTIHTFGVGGMFGYYGKFHTSGIGHITFYATQRKNLILIQTTQAKKIVISPDNPAFLDYIKTQLHSPSEPK